MLHGGKGDDVCTAQRLLSIGIVHFLLFPDAADDDMSRRKANADNDNVE
jgi:hypothetical protein